MKTFIVRYYFFKESNHEETTVITLEITCKNDREAFEKTDYSSIIDGSLKVEKSIKQFFEENESQFLNWTVFEKL